MNIWQFIYGNYLTLPEVQNAEVKKWGGGCGDERREGKG